MPSLVKRDYDVSETQKQSRLLKNLNWNSNDSTSAILLKSRLAGSKSHSFGSRVAPHSFKSAAQRRGKTNLLCRKSTSCPNLQSLMRQTEEKDSKLISQNMTQALTRAISLFIVFPTILLLGDSIFGGIKLAKPHGNTILVLAVYGIFTPLAYILGKPNARNVLVKHFKI